VETHYYDSALDVYCFQKISASEIDIRMRDRTKGVVSFICAELQIFPFPDVIWIQPAPVGVVSQLFGVRVQRYFEETHPSYTRTKIDIRQGYTPEHGRQVWVRSDLSAYPDLEYVVAHEIRHIWQKVNDLKIFHDECKRKVMRIPTLTTP
jgi:hypothetical protein